MELDFCCWIGVGGPWFWKIVPKLELQVLKFKELGTNLDLKKVCTKEIGRNF